MSLTEADNRSGSSKQSHIFIMITNPDPDEISVVFNRERSMGQTRAHRPKLADFLEMESGLSWIFYKLAKTPSCVSLRSLR